MTHHYLSDTDFKRTIAQRLDAKSSIGWGGAAETAVALFKLYSSENRIGHKTEARAHEIADHEMALWGNAARASIDLTGRG